MMNAEQFAERARARREDALSRRWSLGGRASMRRCASSNGDGRPAGGRLDQAAPRSSGCRRSRTRRAGRSTRRSARSPSIRAQLEQSEERLFALRAAGPQAQMRGRRPCRNCCERFEGELRAIGDGGRSSPSLRAPTCREAQAPMTRPQSAEPRAQGGASDLDKAVLAELPPLKLERARFETRDRAAMQARPGPHGIDRVEFLVAANPGTPLGALDESGFGRRACALHAGAQSHSRRQGLGADADLR